MMIELRCHEPWRSSSMDLLAVVTKAYCNTVLIIEKLAENWRST
jgi:hypothetical protein